MRKVLILVSVIVGFILVFSCTSGDLAENYLS
jgi:hypothetical protein